MEGNKKERFGCMEVRSGNVIWTNKKGTWLVQVPFNIFELL
jgi:hypothetical protein